MWIKLNAANLPLAVFEFATSFYHLIQCHTRHKILFYKINTFTVQVTKMDACIVKQYEWRICILIIHPMILVAKWATSFWFLVAHRQDLVALASGRAVICNPVIRMEQKKNNNTSSQMLLDHCYTFGLLLWPSNSEEVVLWRRALIDLLWPCPGSTTVWFWPNSQYKCAGVMSTPKCL